MKNEQIKEASTEYLVDQLSRGPTQQTLVKIEHELRSRDQQQTNKKFWISTSIAIVALLLAAIGLFI